MHTFRLVNSAGRSTYVKFHWKPARGLQSVVWNEAVKINGADPDFHRRDLWEAIRRGDYPEWKLCLQLFDDDFANQFEFDVLDPTKLIGYTSGAVLFEAAGLPTDPASADDGFISLSEHPAAEFIARCRQLRHWTANSPLRDDTAH